MAIQGKTNVGKLANGQDRAEVQEVLYGEKVEQPNINELRLERMKEEATMKGRGFSIDSILTTINSKNQEKGWGTISRRMLFYDLHQYYKMARANPEVVINEAENYKEMQIAQLEDNIDILTRMITEGRLPDRDVNGNKIVRARNKLTNGQLIYAISVKGDMITRVSELRGLIGKNSNVFIQNNIQQNNNILDKYDAASRAIKTDDTNITKRIAGLFRDVVRESREREGLTMDSGVAGTTRDMEVSESVDGDVHRQPILSEPSGDSISES